jgi:hypothetical protein
VLFGSISLHRRTWEAKILETLDRRPKKSCNYILLRSEQVILFPVTEAYHQHLASQLVGTALIVLVKEELTAVLRNVEGASRKVRCPNVGIIISFIFCIDWPPRYVR